MMAAESSAKKETYNKILTKLALVSSQIEEERKKSERFRIILQGKIDSYKKTNERAFEKLRADRLERQRNIEKFIEEKTQWLLKKSILSLTQIQPQPLEKPYLILKSIWLSSKRLKMKQLYSLKI